MMSSKIPFTNQLFDGVAVEAERLLGVYAPADVRNADLTDAEIEAAIVNPIGSPPLRELAKGRKDVLIVTDDNTRHTPIKRLIPPVLDELRCAQVPSESISFLIGSGTHRPMTEEEIREKFGSDLAQRFTISNHAWNDPAALLSVGKHASGFDIVVNRKAVDADLVISIGSIYPHATSGFSGGAKTVMTGIAGERTIENTHWMALDYSMQDILGREGNPVRRAFNDLGRKIGLEFIVNTVLFDGDKIFGVATGDVEAAHKRGVDMSRDVYGASVPRKADIVIAEAYPAEIDLRQAIKAVCAADLVCRDGGVIILVAECPEGVAPQFPDFAKYGFKDPEALYKNVQDGIFRDKLMAYTLVAVGRILAKCTAAILVSPHIPVKEAERLGFAHATSVDEALLQATELAGDDSRVAVLKKASVLLPVMQDG